MSINQRFALANFAIAVLVSQVGIADDTAKPFNTSPAKKARTKYDQGLTKIMAEYDKEFEKLTLKYIDDLTAARKSALEANKLDEAQNIAVKVKELQTYLQHQSPRKGTLSVGMIIIDARWGAFDTWIDVTDKVRSEVRNGRLVTRKAGHTYGDPKVGYHKSLVVVYRFRGRIRTAILPAGKPASIP